MLYAAPATSSCGPQLHPIHLSSSTTIFQQTKERTDEKAYDSLRVNSRACQMKQEIPTTPPRCPPPPPPKSSPAAASARPSSQSKIPSRTKASPKPRLYPKPEKVSSGVAASPESERARAHPFGANASLLQKSTKRHISLNKGKNSEEYYGSGSRNRLWVNEQSSSDGPGRRRREAGDDGDGRRNGNANGGDPDEEKEELKRKVVELEGFVADLKGELEGLKAELHNVRSSNADLQIVNDELAKDLVVAEAKIASLNTSPDQSSDELVGKCQVSKFNASQKLNAQKPQHPKGDNTTLVQLPEVPPYRLAGGLKQKTPTTQCPSPPPPPPPPAPPRLPVRANAPSKPPPVIEFYQSLAKREGNKNIASPINQYRPAVTSAHSSIVGEIQNRSTHLLAIKADVESKGEFIKDLIQRVLDATFADIEDVLIFVNWLDSQLSTLADERAVLKHFQWPERKADAMREAAVEYRGFKSLKDEVTSYADDGSLPCGVVWKKISNLMDKLERGIQRLVKLRSTAMSCYQYYKLPSDWMLDSGMATELKQASTKLARLYLKRVITELQSAHNLEREPLQEALLLQAMDLAYRIHQFAGGLDSETMCAFEEIRQRVPQKIGVAGGPRPDQY